MDEQLIGVTLTKVRGISNDKKWENMDSRVRPNYTKNNQLLIAPLTNSEKFALIPVHVGIWQKPESPRMVPTKAKEKE